MYGSVSGGCVESEVVEACRSVLGGGPPHVLTYGISNDQALEVGLPCGGEIDVFVNEPERGLLTELADIVRGGSRAVVFTNLETGEQRLVREGEDEFADGVIRAAHSGFVGELFAEVHGPPPRLLVFGAVDLAEELARAAGRLGWRTIVADARAAFATRERISSADELLVAWPDQVLAAIAPDHATAVVVLTHEERFDVPALVGALGTDAFYVGALGSRRTQERRREQLLEAGVSEDRLERLHGPVGLDIGAHTPAETAVSILAEILAVRAGRTGASLRESAQPRIHAEV